MYASKKLEKIKNSIEFGSTIYISTCTKITKITPKTFKKWCDSGHDLFKVSGKSLYMASGKNYVCIDYAEIKAVK